MRGDDVGDDEVEVHLGDDKALVRDTGEGIGEDGDALDEVGQEEKGDDVDDPGEEAKGEQVDGQKQELDDRFDDFVKKGPDGGGGQIGGRLVVDGQAGIEHGHQIEGNQIEEDGPQNCLHKFSITLYEGGHLASFFVVSGGETVGFVAGKLKKLENAVVQGQV